MSVIVTEFEMCTDECWPQLKRNVSWQVWDGSTKVVLEWVKDAVCHGECDVLCSRHLFCCLTEEPQPLWNNFNWCPFNCGKCKLWLECGCKETANLILVQCILKHSLQRICQDKIPHLRTVYSRSIWCVEDHRVLTSKINMSGSLIASQVSLRPRRDSATSFNHACFHCGLDLTKRTTLRIFI